MKRCWVLIALIALVFVRAQAQQFSPLCVVTGTLYNPDGSPARNVPLLVMKVQKTGAAFVPSQKPIYSDATTGAITFTVPRGSTAWLYCEAYIGSLYLGKNGGVSRAIPNAATATLESLGEPVTGTAPGVTVRDEGTGLATLVNDFDFVGSGVSVSQPSGGKATVTITGGGGGGSALDFREADGSPSITGTTMFEFNQAAGFVLTDQGSNVTRLDLSGVPYSKLNLSGSIVDADVSSSAAIAESKIAGLVNDLAGKAAASHTHVESDITNLVTDLAGKVPTTRTINGFALSSNITLGKSDIGLGSVANSLQLIAANNLSDLVNAGTARSNLGVTIGTDVQAFDADLDAVASLTGTGFLKRTGVNTWSLDGSTYLTGNQTITLSGDISGSGATSITTTIGAGKVTNAMLAEGIAYSKLNLTGTPDGTKFLRDDGSWQAAGGGISGLTTGKLSKAASSSTLGDSILTETTGLISNSGSFAQAGSTTIASYLRTNSGNLASSTNLNPGILVFGDGSNNPYGLHLGAIGGTGYALVAFFPTGAGFDFAYFSTGTVPTAQSNFTRLFRVDPDLKMFRMGSTGILGYANAADPTNTIDSGFSRISSGLIGVGTGAQGSFAGSLKLTDVFTNNASFLIRTTTTITGGGTSQVPTLTAGPVAGNPTKWIAIDDNGTTRYIPTW